MMAPRIPLRGAPLLTAVRALEAPIRARSILTGPRGTCHCVSYSSLKSLGLLHCAFQRFGEACGNVEAGLLGDLDESCRTGDIDLGQIIADDVEADDEQPLGRKLRSDALRDLAIAPRQRTGDALAARGEVAARLARLRNARQRVRHRLAGDQNDALVAIDDLWDEPLRHHAARAVMSDGLDDDVAVRVVLANAKHRSTAHAVER